MTAWAGFATMRHDEDGRYQLHVMADVGYSDEDPVPLAVLAQTDEMIELTEAELRWLVEEVAPVVLRRMRERP